METKIDKTIRLGEGDAGSVFCRIQYGDGKLSITGVEGPKRNGDARGSCGQIVMSRPAVTVFAEGWDAESVARFWDVWDAWHLNDMRPGCEHQRAAGWGSEEIEVVTYRLTSEALAERRKVKKRADTDLIESGKAELSNDERALLALPWETNRAPDADSIGSGRYEVETRETKRSGWVRQSEHDRGELCKPCPTCGYAYGTKWLSEDVPADVLDWLASLPDADRTPAWV